MNLPNLKFNLPEWKEADFAMIRRNKEKIADLSNKAGKGSERFKEACCQLKRLAMNGRIHELPEAVQNSIDVRALTFLFSDDDEFLQKVPITMALLDGLYRPRPKLGRLSLLQLIAAFFKHFDQIGEAKVVDYLCTSIRKELNKKQGGNEDSDLTKLNQYKDMLFSLNGPKSVVKFAQDKQMDLDQVFNKLALNGYHGGRFQRVCRFRYYLETLKKLPVGQDHSLLAEICKSEVYNAPSSEGRLMGHDFLEIIIDRSPRQEISDAWRRVVLNIAGDPRVPQASTRYQRWWVLLGEDRARKVRGWLSQFDLLLFLDVLEEYGISSWNTDLQRMFPARKAFLEGLHRQGLISESRLFVSNQAQQYLVNNYRREELPEYAQVRDPYTSMIYLRVGDCHIIEGSHSFKLWILPRLPEQSRITNYSNKIFDREDLSTHLKRQFENEFGFELNRLASIVHTPHGLSWQAKAIEHLRRVGVRLDLEQLFSSEDYRFYKNRYGL